MEPEGLSSRLQEPVTCPYPELEQSSPCPAYAQWCKIPRTSAGLYVRCGGYRVICMFLLRRQLRKFAGNYSKHIPYNILQPICSVVTYSVTCTKIIYIQTPSYVRILTHCGVWWMEKYFICFQSLCEGQPSTILRFSV